MHKTVAEWFCGGQSIEGEVGIEVELEGEQLPQTIPKLSSQLKKYWTVTRDGSLRGEAYEYVLDGPVKRDQVEEALTQLYRKLDTATLVDSGRAGVHVHINVREMTMTQMFNFVLLYLVFEKALVRFCGDSREGNLFCLRICDAEHLAMVLLNAIKNKRFDRLGSDDIRYASINLTALRKYGSLEFRAMRSPVGQDVISQWVKILLALKDSALRFNDPEELMLGVSSEGGYDFARQNLGATMEALGEVDWKVEVLEGLRLIQPLVKALSAKFKEPIKEELPKARKIEAFAMPNFAGIDLARLQAERGWMQPEPIGFAEPAPETNMQQLNRIQREANALPRVRANTFFWIGAH